MQTNSIDSALQQRIGKLNTAQKESLLMLIDSFIDEDIDLKTYSEELEKANAEVENGYFVTHAEALELINDSK
jgi:predicted transcriptional regulator